VNTIEEAASRHFSHDALALRPLESPTEVSPVLGTPVAAFVVCSIVAIGAAVGVAGGSNATSYAASLADLAPGDMSARELRLARVGTAA
jgi:hypothetical protein